LTYFNQQGVYAVGFFLSAGVFGSTFFKQLTAKSQRIQALMLPVSAPERLAVAVLFVLIIFPMVYTSVCLGCLWIMNYIDVHWFGRLNALYYMNDDLTSGYLIIYFYLQALLLLGAVWFRKYTFVKTAVMVCVVAIALTVFNEFLGKSVVNTVPETTKNEVMAKLSPAVQELNYNGSMPYLNMTFTARTLDGGKLKDEYYRVALPPAVKVTVATILILAPFFLWFTTLIKLREQQL
jgi:hypothetical protein